LLLTLTAFTNRTTVSNKKSSNVLDTKRTTPTSSSGNLHPHLVIIAAWFLTRVIALYAVFQTWHPVSGWLADVGLYNFWANNMNNGQFPLNDPMWQYPPLAAVIFLLGFAISHASVGFVTLAVIADAGILALLLVAQHRAATSKSLGLWIWVAAPVLMGPIMLGRFDVFPTLAVIAAIVFSGTAEAFGSLVAIGALLKVWPVLGLIGTPRKDGLRSIIAFLATFIAGSAIMISWWPGSFNFLSGQKARGLQIESLGAWPYMMWNSMGHHVNVALQYGAVEVVAHGTRTVCLIVTLACLVGLGALAVLRFLGRLERATVAHIALTAVLISMITSRVLSPQYTVWVLGLLAVTAFEPPRYFNKIASLLCISALAGNLIYPGYYIAFEVGGKFAMVVQTIRLMTLLAATIISFVSLLEGSGSSAKSKKSLAK
jgi:Glycosyltransferase family 87